MDIFKDTKNYQLQACYNNMLKLRRECSDNLTEMVAIRTMGAIGKEVKERDLIWNVDDYGYHDLLSQEDLKNEAEQASIED